MSQPFDTGLLKSLFARLVRAHGSHDAAAARLDVSRQRIGQLCSASDDHVRDVPTWDQVWALEQALERSVVFAALADMASPAPVVSAACPLHSAIWTVRQASDVLGKIEEAAKDGIDAQEERQIEDALCALENRIALTRRAVNSAAAKLRVVS